MSTDTIAFGDFGTLGLLEGKRLTDKQLDTILIFMAIVHVKRNRKIYRNVRSYSGMRQNLFCFWVHADGSSGKASPSVTHGSADRDYKLDE